MPIFLALVHHPVLDRQGKVVATALTNVDIHDLARSGRTFGCQGVYIVTPVTLQQRMVQEVLAHWTLGIGSQHQRRAEAMRRVAVAASIADACEDIARRTGCAPEVAVTGASMRAPTESFAELRERLRRTKGDSQTEPGRQVRPLLILFGTGWGLTPEVIDAADTRLPPVRMDPDLLGEPGSDDSSKPYNHLSVRAAVAIVLDRLLGER